VLSAAFYLLTLAVAAGTILALWHLRGSAAPRPPAAAGIAHGLVGAFGVALLWPAAFGPPRGVASGAGSFGPMAGAVGRGGGNGRRGADPQAARPGGDDGDPRGDRHHRLPAAGGLVFRRFTSYATASE